MRQGAAIVGKGNCDNKRTNRKFQKVDANAVDGRKGMKVQYLTVMNRREYF